MSKMGNYVLDLMEQEVEIDYALQEARKLNMGNTVPAMTIIRQAAALAKCSESAVEKFYYNGSQFEDESAPW